MRSSDAMRFAEIITGMSEMYGKKLSDFAVELYFKALEEFTIDQVEAACLECVKGRRFSSMPSVAEIIDFIGGGRAEDIAEIEAAKVLQAIRSYGATYNVCFDNATTQAVIVQGFGGWVKMCSDLMEDQVKWFTKDFVRIYGAYQRQGIKHRGILPGRCTGEPKLIGDSKACLAMIADQQTLESEHPSNVVDLVGRIVERVTA